jgi:tetratricopeptide (TPR) repeat protein
VAGSENSSGKAYDEFIKEQIDFAKCMVVLWSKESVKPKEGKWVRTEATIGDKRGILVPVMIDDVEPPIAFMLTEAAKLIDWDGTLSNPEFDLLLSSVAELVGQPPAQKIIRPSTPVATPTVSETTSASEWFDKGFNLGEQGRYQEAIEAYDKALKIDPQYKFAWLNKGWALNNLGRYQEAIEAYDKALKIDPKYKSAWNNKGNALRNLGRYQEAIEAYDKILKIDPKYKSAWNGKGAALRDLGRYQEAIEAYDKALKIDPKYKLALDNKKIVLKELQ